jgi:hypothetical protein
MYQEAPPRLSSVEPGANEPEPRSVQRKGGVPMKIQITLVESIKATRIHLDPLAGGA